LQLGGSVFGRALKGGVGRIIARRKFVRSVRPSDVFLVSYPKSGITWLGFLVANILKTDASEQLTLRSFVKYIPDINGLYFGTGSQADLRGIPDPRLFFVHSPYDPSFPKVVYVLRDPRDVMVSFWHYQKLSGRHFALSMKEFIRKGDHWPCPWDEHVSGWLLEHEHPVLLVVNYEEIHRNTEGILKRVLDFSGIYYSDSDIERAVEESSFDRMRIVEEKFGWQGNAPSRGRFVRRGKVGVWKEEMDQESLCVLEEKYHTVMRKVGYEPAT